MTRKSWGSGLLGPALLLVAAPAAASSAIEFPDNGVAQFSRGGAWLATATDPIAGYYNPAALARQTHGVGIGLNVVLQEICFDRTDPETGGPYPEVCNDGGANVIPNLAGVWRAGRDLGIGLTITPPASFGTTKWPDVATYQDPGGLGEQRVPAPQRYLSMGVKGTILWPTLGVGYQLTDQLAVGAGFVAGIAILELKSMSMGQVSASDPGDDPATDTHSTLSVKDMFVPGAVVSSLYSPSKNIDVAGWYRISDKIRAKGDLEVLAPYYTPAGQPRTICKNPGDSVGGSCAEVTKSEDEVGADAAEVTITVPMEARIGIRWHMPLAPAQPLQAASFRHDPWPVRDPLRDDLYDVELDLTWANNSAADTIQVRFPEGIAVAGSPGSVPTNADRPTGYQDSFGARLGGQYNVIRSKLGVRLGTWVETAAMDAEYLTVTGVPAFRGGLAGGLVFRVQAVDLELGYQRIWNAGLDNDANGKLRAIAGTSTGSWDPGAENRSYHTVNDGKVSQHANVFSLGGVVRF